MTREKSEGRVDRIWKKDEGKKKKYEMGKDAKMDAADNNGDNMDEQNDIKQNQKGDDDMGTKGDSKQTPYGGNASHKGAMHVQEF